MTDILIIKTTGSVNADPGSSPTVNVGLSKEILRDSEQFPSLGGSVQTVSSPKMQSVSSPQKTQSVSSPKMQLASSVKKQPDKSYEQQLALVQHAIRKVTLEELEAVKAELEQKIADEKAMKVGSGCESNSYALMTKSTSAKRDLSPKQKYTYLGVLV